LGGGGVKTKRVTVNAETGEIRVEECEVELRPVEPAELPPPPIDLEKLVQVLIQKGVIKSREEVEASPSAGSTPGQ